MRKLYDKFLRISDNEKITEQKFLTNLIVSVFSIFLSVVMLCSTTYAYFKSTVTSSVETLKSAEYIAEVIVTPSEKVTVSEGEYTFADAGTYEIALKAAGTASTGYFKITVRNDANGPYVTGSVANGEEFKVILNAEADTIVTIEAFWGANGVGSVMSPLTIGQSSTAVLIEEEIATLQYKIHTVADDETLESIAQHYGLTVEEICEYNDIPIDTVFVAGQQIAIPITDRNNQEENEDSKEDIAEQELIGEDVVDDMQDQELEGQETETLEQSETEMESVISTESEELTPEPQTLEPQDPTEPAPQVEEPEITPTEEVTE